MKPTIYIISGLGADKRMFQNFSFECYNVIHIDWALPLENESLQNYALRISENMIDKESILIGLSFGGILSVEISKIKKFKKVFLLSSAKTKFEIPFYFRFLGALNMLKIIPIPVLKRVNFLSYFIFGAKTKDEKSLLKDIIANTNEKFFLFFLYQIINWKNETYFENITHIQGDKDLILPHYFVKYNYLIEEGTHFMTLNKSEYIEKIIFKNIE